MKYSYGSKPVCNYDYISFIKHLAPVLPADDQVFFHNNSTQWRKHHNRIPLSLFRNICHWKSPRKFKKYVLKNTESEVHKQWQIALQHLNKTQLQEEAIIYALKELIKLEGVGIPTASALLTAWNPIQFCIIDFKVLDVLRISGRNSPEQYVKFRNKLLEFKRTHQALRNCALRQIELALWHYYSIQNANTRKW